TAWEAGANRVRSYDAYVSGETRTLLETTEWKPRDVPLIDSAKVREIYRDGLRRIEGERPPGYPPQPNLLRTQIWDGRRDVVDDRAFGQGIRFSDTFDFPWNCDLETLYRTVSGDTVLYDLLRERRGTKIERREGEVFVLHTPTTLGKHYNYSPYGFRI